MVRLRGHRLVVLGAVALALVAAVPPQASSEGIAVGAAVASTVSLTNNCGDPAALDFGAVFPNDKRLSTTGAGICSFAFQSDTDSVMLRVSQADRSGAAMTRDTFPAFTEQVAPAKRHTAVGASPVTTGRAWAAGNDGLVWRTLDGGASWASSAGSAAGRVTDIDAANDSTVWLTTVVSNEILRSTDGGVTWAAPTAMPPGGSKPWQSVEAFPGGIVIVAGDLGMYRSTDGGDSWSEVIPPTLSSEHPYSWVDANGAVVWAASMTGDLAISTDSGATWSTASGTPCGCIMDSVTVVDDQIAYVSQGAFVYRTTDGGASWPVAYNTTPELGAEIDSIKAVGVDTAWVVTDHGHLLRTVDGQNWTSVDSNTGNRLRALDVKGSNFYAVGNGLTRIYSGDGASWTLQNSGGVDWAAVTAPTAQRAWVVGGGGVIKTSANAGTTWTAQASSTTANLRSVSAPSPTVAWAVGEDGVVVRTTDAGATAWQVLAAPTARDLLAVDAVDANTAYVVGTGGSIYSTDDGGSTWSDHSRGTAAFNGVDAVDSDNVVVVGDDGVVLYTDDAGTTWKTPSTIEGAPGTTLGAVSLKSVSSPTHGVIWIAADDNEPWLSTDGGDSWTQPGFGPAGRDVGIAAIDGQTVFLATTSRRARSINGGFSWGTDGNTGGAQYAVAAHDAHTAYFVGEGGLIYTLAPDASVADIDIGGGVGWADDNAGAFGMCVQAVSASTTPVLPYSVDGSCSAVDGDLWNAVPQSATKIATVATPGAAGRIDLVWGLRVGGQTPPGSYRAAVLVEAIAPNL